MNNKISNPKIEIPKGMNLNDKDYINCLLSSLKELEKNYTVALTEASNETLYKEYRTMFNNYASLQREVYELMFRKGLYSIEKAETQKISEKFNTLNQEFISLSE